MLSAPNGCTRFLVVAGFLCGLPAQSSPPQAPPSSPEGLRLLHKMQHALGGAKRIAEVRDFEEVIRAEARDSTGAPLGEVRKRTRWVRTPNLLRVDQIGPRGTYVLYFDGPCRLGDPTRPAEPRSVQDHGNGNRTGRWGT